MRGSSLLFKLSAYFLQKKLRNLVAALLKRYSNQRSKTALMQISKKRENTLHNAQDYEMRKDWMKTQEAYLGCSKHCATFPPKQTIHPAVVAQVLPLVLVVKISLTELSSVPPPLCFLQDSWTVSHDQCNHPPSESKTSCEILVSDTVWGKKKMLNRLWCVQIWIMRLCCCSVSSGDIFEQLRTLYRSVSPVCLTTKISDEYAF